MNYTVIPYASIGEFKINQNRQVINNLLGGEFKTLTYSYSTDVTDIYTGLGLRFDYNENGNCISIHVEAPSNAIYEGQNLHIMSLDDILAYFTKSERRAYVDDNNLLLLDSGLGFSFSDRERKGTPQLITIFENGLFDEFLHEYQKIEM